MAFGLYALGTVRLGDDALPASTQPTSYHASALAVSYSSQASLVTTLPLGRVLFGLARFGDGYSTHAVPRFSTISVLYTSSASRYALPLSVSYVSEARNVAPILAYYFAQPASAFAINGDATIIKPDHITYTPKPVVATTVIGGTIIQGYATMIWTYSVLEWPEYAKLFSYYTPQQPQVTLTYLDDETGTWVQRIAYMRPPTYGGQTTFIVSGITLTFLLPLLS